MLCRLPPYRVDLMHVPHAAVEGVDWAVAAYGIPALWKGTQGEGVTVAVLDSGCAPHPALTEAVVDHRNFTSDTEAYDTLGHGTHVCGVIGARTGLAQGIAHKCQIVSCKVLGHSGTGSNDSVAQAVRFAVDRKVDLICMSLGSPRPSAAVHGAVQYACDQGVIVVCAAGNDGGPVNYPAGFDETVAVGAVDKNGEICRFSCSGPAITVAAPGQDITSTWIGGGYAKLTGTSMAAPFVTGVLALWVAANRPVTCLGAFDALRDSSRDAGEPGRDPAYGWGLVDPRKLLRYET